MYIYGFLSASRTLLSRSSRVTPDEIEHFYHGHVFSMFRLDASHLGPTPIYAKKEIEGLIARA